jgi:hypothetical protein
MTKTKVILRLMVFAWFCCVVVSQPLTATSQTKSILDLKVENVHLYGPDIEHILGAMALEYHIPIGLELSVSNSTFQTIDLEKGTLTDLLTKIIGQYPSYYWQINDGVVNVLPKPGYGDSLSNEVLETKISKFSTKGANTCWNIEKSIMSEPKLKRALASHKLGHYGPELTGFYFCNVGNDFVLDVADMQLTVLLNRIIRDNDKAKFWFLGRTNDQPNAFLLGFYSDPPVSFPSSAQF